MRDPFAQVVDHRAGDAEPTVNAEEKKIAEKNHSILSGDGGMSWGRGGQTETTAERGAETIPLGAAESLGISPEVSTQTSPTPSDLGRPTQPDSGHGADGNHNMSHIAAYSIGTLPRKGGL